MKNLFLYSFVILSLFSCSKGQPDIVNLYTQRHYKVDEVQYKKFTEMTGIKVNWIKSNADELIERLKNEGNKSPADIFISVDAGKLQKAASLNLLQKLPSEIKTENIQNQLLDKNNFWAPLTYRSRILVYSNERVNKSDLNTYESLADEKWKNRILVRSSSNAYNQALMASIIALAANFAGTYIIEAVALVLLFASFTVLKTGRSKCFSPPFPGVTPPTKFVPYFIDCSE